MDAIIAQLVALCTWVTDELHRGTGVNKVSIGHAEIPEFTHEAVKVLVANFPELHLKHLNGNGFRVRFQAIARPALEDGETCKGEAWRTKVWAQTITPTKGGGGRPSVDLNAIQTAVWQETFDEVIAMGLSEDQATIVADKAAAKVAR